MMALTCFVISPIGEKGSDTRQLANDVYDLIIEPSLEKYGFDVVRADKIASTGSITHEVIKFVQSADLCIIDITGHNPNVMYECGRRHESGKPYIMIAKEGEKLAFDIITIRTIFYDISDTRNIRDTSKSIQSVVSTLINEGFSAQSSGESLSSISDSLKRLERKIDDLKFIGGPSVGGRTTVSESTQDILRSLGPIGAFNYALTQRDPRLADDLIPRLEVTTPREKFVAMVLTQAAAIGSKTAAGRLENDILPQIQSFDIELQKRAVSSYVQALSIFDEEARGLSVLQPLISKIMNENTDDSNYSKTEKAFILNQYQRLLHGCGRYKEASNIGSAIIKLCPNDPTYYYNQSMNEEELGDIKKASENVDKYMNIYSKNGESDDDHLQRAVVIYAKVGDTNKAKDAYAKLLEVNRFKAEIALHDDDVRKVIRQI